MNQFDVEAFAYGRVNLIGEHTDYNGGWVLPTAIPQKTTVRLRVRTDKWVTAETVLTPLEPKVRAKYQLGSERPEQTWLDYIQGATFLLRQSGHNLSGFDLQIESNVPMGSGLSSSAALEISLLKALREAFSLPLDTLEMARLGQRIENEFVGAQIGIMDQMACALAKYGEALYLDTKSLEFERVALPLNSMDLVVINSGVDHNHATGDYNQRRSECEKACARLGVTELRELGMSDLPSLEKLPEILQRRARHVITENERVHLAVQSLKTNDMQTLGQLFYASHASMRDDFQVSVEEIDLLVQVFQQQKETFGARLTGGGFGGSVVALTQKGAGSSVAEQVVSIYQQKTKAQATILIS